LFEQLSGFVLREVFFAVLVIILIITLIIIAHVLIIIWILFFFSCVFDRLSTICVVEFKLSKLLILVVTITIFIPLIEYCGVDVSIGAVGVKGAVHTHSVVTAFPSVRSTNS
jgi:hypothetical protein